MPGIPPDMANRVCQSCGRYNQLIAIHAIARGKLLMRGDLTEIVEDPLEAWFTSDLRHRLSARVDSNRRQKIRRMLASGANSTDAITDRTWSGLITYAANHSS